MGELPPPGDLQKHQAFQAEVQAPEEVIMSVAKVTARPSACPKVESQERP